MKIYSVEDIKESFPWRNKPILFLHISVLLYFAVLPFVPFGFTVWGHAVKYTQLALILVGLAGIYAYFQGALKLRRANWLYVFLGLNAAAQLLSILNAPMPVADYGVGISVAIYSAVIFVLVNAIRSEALIKAIFVLMGGVVLVVAIHSFILFVGGVQGGHYQPREQLSLIGNELPIALAYLLIMYGSGFLFLFFREKDQEIRSLRWILASLWMYVIVLTSAKAAHIAFLLFLAGLWIILKSYRRQIAVMSAIFVVLFLFQWRFGSVVAGFYTFRTRALDADLIISDYANKGLDLLISGRQVKIKDFSKAQSPENVPTDQTSTLAEFSPQTDLVAEPSEKIADSAQRADSLIQAGRPSEENSETKANPAVPEETTLPAPSTASTPTPELAVNPSTLSPSLAASAPASLFSPSPEILFSDLEPDLIVSVPISAQPSSNSVSEVEHELDFLQRRWSDQGLRSSIELRTRGILTGWYMGAAYPLTGAGPGQSGFLFNHFSEVIRERSHDSSYLWFLPRSIRGYFKNDQRWSSALTNTHNIFLNAWAETGLLGLAAIVGLFSVVLVKGARAIRHTYRTPGLYSYQFLIPALLGLLFIHQTIFLFVHPWIWSMLALMYAAVDLSIKTLKHESIKAVDRENIKT